MTNKKLFVIILSAVVLSAVTSIAAYKIFSKNTTFIPSQTQSNPNFESIVDSIDYSENLLDSNQAYKERFEPELNSQGRWIPIKSTDLIKELTTPDEVTTQQPEVQNVSNNVPANENQQQNLLRENTSIAKYNAPAENIQQVETQADNNTNQIVEEKKTTEVKIIYIWQPNECSGSSWNPYTYGRWEFTSCGWMWRSSYGWGRHCYNYGRWFWSSYYGWVWMPGGRWAPSWVTWRHCGDYYGHGYYAWYPTCPRIYWRDYVSHLVVCNSHFTSNPVHWTVVPTTNITKTITDGTKIKPEHNSEILNNTSKVKTVNTLAIDDQKIKYTGPNVNEVSKVTKSTITPKKVDIPNEVAGNNGTKQTYVTSDPGSKIKPVKNTVVTDPAIYNEVTNTPKVTNPVKSSEPTKTTITKTEPPVKTADPSKTNIKNEPTKTVTTAPPTKTTTETPKEPTKQNPPTKKQDPQTPKTPKQDPPVTKTPKYDPPKYDPPKTNNPPPTRNDTPKNDPPKQDPPPVKSQPPPTKQEAPKNDPPPKKDDTGKKGD